MRGGKKGSKRGRERVLVENEDEIIARNMMERDDSKWGNNRGDEENSDNSAQSSDVDESVEEPREEAPREDVPPQPVFEKSKPIQTAIFENGNLNRGNSFDQKRNRADKDGQLEVQLSGKQKRELEAERRREEYFQRTLEGKTPEAKATLERLARIRAQREEAARRRKEEEAARAQLQERIKEKAAAANANAKKKKK